MVETTGANNEQDFQDIIDGGNIGGFGGDNDEQEFAVIDSGNQNPDDDYFDQVVGCIQEILIDPEFEQMQKKFVNQHCMQFEATEENKLIYTTVFKEYTDTIETYLNSKLEGMVADFSMDKFITLLKDRKDEIDEPLMDLLLSFSEFESFKEMMLFARAHFVATTPKQKSGKAAALGLKDGKELAAASGQLKELSVSGESSTKLEAGDLKHFENCIDGLQISGKATKVHKDEMADGEERPDLNLQISSAK